MSTSSSQPRLVFLGTHSAFSQAVLAGLLRKGRNVVAVVLSGEGWRPLLPPPPLSSDLPLLAPFVGTNVVTTAWAAGVPVWEVGRWEKAARAEVWSFTPDAIVVACWPRRVPDAVLQGARWGGLNIHPSLLPDWRGPAPLFWQRRAGLQTGGVTVHRMSARLDEGAILAQALLPLPDGATGPELDALTGALGARLVGEALDVLATGYDPARPQPPGGSYQGWPTECDWIVPTHWDARRAWNFLRATEEWGRLYTLLLPPAPLFITRALAWLPHERLPIPLVKQDTGVLVRFVEGALLVEPG